MGLFTLTLQGCSASEDFLAPEISVRKPSLEGGSMQGPANGTVDGNTTTINAMYEIFYSPNDGFTPTSDYFPWFSLPAPTGGIAPLHLYRCTNADDKDSSWEINMDDVDTSGADCLRDGMCVHFAEDYVKGMVEVYEAD